MKNGIRALNCLAVALLLLVLGCARYPLGLSEDQWKAMTPQQQSEAQAKQAEIDREKARLEAIQREKERQERLREQARVDEIYANAQYGDIVECSLSEGKVHFYSGWQSTQAAFTLVPSETKELRLTAEGRRDTKDIWVSLDRQKSTVSLCYYDPAKYRSNNCATLAGISRDFHRGIEKTLHADKFFSYVKLRCAYRLSASQLVERSRTPRHTPDRSPGRSSGRHHHGRTVECVIAGGSSVFRKQWKPIHDVTFNLESGEKRALSMSSRDGRDRSTFWAERDRNGRKITICGYRPFGTEQSRCDVIGGLSRDFERGMSRSLDLGGTIRDASVRCAYARPGRRR